jgi:para-aminobenzoate synthetase
MPVARRLDFLPSPERAFAHLFGSSPNAFWLDGEAPGERARFSFMGDDSGPGAAVLTCDVGAGEIRVERAGRVEVRRQSLFDCLAAELERRACWSPELPFEFNCGFAGYLGYEMKAECGGGVAHRAPAPDAAFVFADRLLAFDHVERHAYVLGLDAADPWIDETSERLRSLPPLARPPWPGHPERFELRRSEARYREDVEACRRYLTAGDSYEICLTNQLTATTAADPLALYRALRRANPAPFSAFLRFRDLAVLSSSPERFLAIDRDGWAEARPIKGTSRRGETPAEDARLAASLRADAKARAENVTIVDLMRNDLGRVCEVGTVSVPELMRVESYESVHQLVSSVRGRLRADLGAIDCARACFPPGSMTGAPKLRTMEILDELEGGARGVYSGAIGYFGLGGGCDLSVAIRAAVIGEGEVSIGAGGAIVVESDAERELEEMLLKARAVTSAFRRRAPLTGRT